MREKGIEKIKNEVKEKLQFYYKTITAVLVVTFLMMWGYGFYVGTSPNTLLTRTLLFYTPIIGAFAGFILGANFMKRYMYKLKVSSIAKEEDIEEDGVTSSLEGR